MDLDVTDSAMATQLMNGLSENNTINIYSFSTYDDVECPDNSRLLDLEYYSDKDIEILLYTPEDRFVITILFPIIMTIGILSNCLFLFTIVRVPSMRTLTNFYLVNLACADLIYILVTAVNRFYQYIWSSELQNGVPWQTTVGCGAVYSITYFPFFASICLVTIVSVERFLAICYPVSYRNMNSRSHALVMTLVAWISALLLTALVAPAWAEQQSYCIIWPHRWQHRLPKVVHFCNSVKEVFTNIASICEFGTFIVAVVINTILYSLIIHRLSQRGVSDQGKSNTKQQHQPQQNTSSKRVRNSVAKMLVINGIAFFVCLTPYQFFNMYYFVEGTLLDDSVVYIIGYVGRTLSALNSAINPIIYGATNPRYRQAFLSAIGCVSKTRDGTMTFDKNTM